MATLTTEQRAALWAELMQELSRDGETVGITKPELRAAVDALDTWLDTNAATINTAIPQPARSALTASQKARLLMFVVRYRYVESA
jgi:hypothetical protein